MRLKFRPALLTDAPAIAAIVNSAYRGDSSRKGWTTEADILAGQRTDAQAIAELLNKPESWIVLGENLGDLKLLGSVHLERVHRDTCYFGMFAIEPEIQSQGLGKKMIQEAERFALEELQCRHMEMTVIALREELIAFYERRGYFRTGETRPFPYGNERFGIPLRDDITLSVLRKTLG